ncbi:MAG: substrate-binding domain-containing protein [Ancalomicrobiaceae bacterium]|nr:substrate-binding domain-containing protein [Ancalomicrobiaceae bacterium]
MKHGWKLVGLAAAMSVFGLAGAAAAQDNGVGAAKADIAKYSKIPAFIAAGAPFDAKACMHGKSIMSLPANSSVPFLSTIDAAMTKVAGMVGFDFKVWENQGQVSQWVQGMDFAANNHYSLVDLLAGTDPRALGPQIKAANDAGTTVTGSHVTGYGQPIPIAGVTPIPIDYKEAGKLIAEWPIVKTGGKVNAIVLVTSEVLSTDPMIEGIKEAFASCPDCKFKVIDVSLTDWATKIQPSVQSAVIADPTVNYIIPIYDSMSQFVVPALQITGASDHVKISTFNGTPFVIDMVRNGQVEMDVGENLDWIAYGLLDAQMRKLCGFEAVTDPKIPLMVFDAGNAATAGVPAEASRGFGDAYIKGFKALWKL